MSLKVIKAGILDTIQDLGRYGFQHLGLNPGGVMDRFSAQVVNLLVGNDVGEPVIEIHFPASTFLFEQEALIAIGGGDFQPVLNGEEIPNNRPVIVSKNSILQFQRWKKGARCYLAAREKFDVRKWLNSASTNLKAVTGGVSGRALQKDDTIAFCKKGCYTAFLGDNDCIILSWQADMAWSETAEDRIAFVTGHEWNWLTEESKRKFLGQPFAIGASADRMGFRIQGSLETRNNEDLVSAAVSFGTIQLLPNGELIILMADHQTTGGYPRLGFIASAHLPALAQKQPGDKICFRMVDQRESGEMLFQQQQHLLQLQNACKFRLEEFLHDH